VEQANKKNKGGSHYIERRGNAQAKGSRTGIWTLSQLNADFFICIV